MNTGVARIVTASKPPVTTRLVQTAGPDIGPDLRSISDLRRLTADGHYENFAVMATHALASCRAERGRNYRKALTDPRLNERRLCHVDARAPIALDCAIDEER
jgi:hypothetical protein